jgi:hypothetical protein
MILEMQLNTRFSLYQIMIDFCSLFPTTASARFSGNCLAIMDRVYDYLIEEAEVAFPIYCSDYNFKREFLLV